jgi:polyadenylate-binding protein 2
MTEEFAAKLAKLNEQKRLRLEEEAKLRAEQEAAAAAAAAEEPEWKPPSDENSVFVGGLDLSVKKEDITEFFQECGKVVRCTLPTDQYTHKSKGYAYIEFSELEAVENALKFDGQLLKGRAVQVKRKRTNTPAPRRRRFRRR